MSRRHPTPATTPSRPAWTREADDRMVTLLGELQEARNDVARALPDYLHALKRWTSLVEVMTKNSVGLADALFSRYDLGNMTNAQMAAVMKQTDQDHDPDSCWRNLNEAAERFYQARVRFVTRQSAVIGYMQYAENLGVKGRDREDVPSMLIGHMLDASENGGGAWELELGGVDDD